MPLGPSVNKKFEAATAISVEYSEKSWLERGENGAECEWRESLQRKAFLRSGGLNYIYKSEDGARKVEDTREEVIDGVNSAQERVL